MLTLKCSFLAKRQRDQYYFTLLMERNNAYALSVSISSSMDLSSGNNQRCKQSFMHKDKILNKQPKFLLTGNGQINNSTSLYTNI